MEKGNKRRRGKRGGKDKTRRRVIEKDRRRGVMEEGEEEFLPKKGDGDRQRRCRIES